MEALHFLTDLVLHLDRHLVEMLVRFDVWIYAVLFLIIFAETGLVVTPFLPGDSLLFAAGALAAIDVSHTLRLGALLPLLVVAAILGNTVNYWLGRYVGVRAHAGRLRFVKVAYLQRADEFFARHGALAIVLSRFIPIVRTFTPFAAGISGMHAGAFQLYNVAGGSGWITLFICGGYLFGNLPLVKANFGLVTLGIVVLSLLPLLVVAWRDARERRQWRGPGAHG
ncbi:MAG: VTT domain-containing protein [Steroidobacteraceae bacterium]